MVWLVRTLVTQEDADVLAGIVTSGTRPPGLGFYSPLFVLPLPLPLIPFYFAVYPLPRLSVPISLHSFLFDFYSFLSILHCFLFVFYASLTVLHCFLFLFRFHVFLFSRIPFFSPLPLFPSAPFLPYPFPSHHSPFPLGPSPFPLSLDSLFNVAPENDPAYVWDVIFNPLFFPPCVK